LRNKNNLSSNENAMSNSDQLSAPPDPKTVSYKHLAMRYGLIWGGAGIFLTLLGYLTNTDPQMPDTSTWAKILHIIVGYGIAIWAVYASIKTDRDAQLGKYISLSRCVGHGTLIGVYAGLLTGVFMLIFTWFIAPDYLEILKNAELAKAAAQGANDEALEMTESILSFFFNPISFAIMAVIVTVITGLIIGLIVGLIMKRERPAV
jgi:hypothetical protein